MNQPSYTKRGNAFIRGMNIFSRKLESSYVEIPDSVIRLLDAELHNSDNILYYYSQVDSLTIPIQERLLKKNKLMRYKCEIYNLYFALTKNTPPRLSIRNVRKPRCFLNSYINYVRNIYQTIAKAFLNIISFSRRFYWH